jgi:hypothetical protein
VEKSVINGNLSPFAAGKLLLDLFNGETD